MLIRDRSNMEKAMSITYKDIVLQRIEMDQKYQKRKALLQTEAGKLVKEYSDSLKIPADKWHDGEREQSFVRTGITNAAGNFERRPVRASQLDDKYRVNFILSTAVNTDVSGGEWIYVPVSVWMNNGYINVSINNGTHELTIANGDDEGRYLEAATLLKQQVMLAILEPDLE